MEALNGMRHRCGSVEKRLKVGSVLRSLAPDSTSHVAMLYRLHLLAREASHARQRTYSWRTFSHGLDLMSSACWAGRTAWCWTPRC